MTDIDGLYTDNPRTCDDATLITQVLTITPEIEGLAKGAGSAFGTGGMATKIQAARIACAAGIHTVVACGDDSKVLYTLLDGKEIGTWFMPEKKGD